MRKENDYCVILAGGQGRRLWPYSRKKKPKQFIDFFGNGQSLLQQTYKRFAQFIPEDHIYVSTFADYADITYEQLPNLPKENVLLEPVQLSTAPAVGMAHCKIALRDPNANIIISPCDQFIMDEERFTSQLIQGLAFVERNPDFLALGVNPTYPNTGYGYIQMSNETKGQGYARIKSFTEKPEAEFARMFVQSGEFLWNTGLFLWNVQTMDEELPALLPAVSLFRSSSNHGAGLAESWRSSSRPTPPTTIWPSTSLSWSAATTCTYRSATSDGPTWDAGACCTRWSARMWTATPSRPKTRCSCRAAATT